MIENIVSIFKDVPKEVATAIIAALPILELRGSIPVGLLSFKLPLAKVFILSVIGNLIPIPFLLLFLKPVSEKLRHFKLWRKFFDYLFERTKRKASLIEKYEALGLVLFVAIPLPVTGAWTGSIAASLFKIRFRYAFSSICLGVLIAGIIVSATTIAGEGIIRQLFLVQ